MYSLYGETISIDSVTTVTAKIKIQTNEHYLKLFAASEFKSK